MNFDPEELLKHGINPAELPNLWQMLDQYQAAIGKVHESLQNPDEKRVLGEVLDRIQKARREAEDILPKDLERMKAGAQALEGKLAALAKRMEETKQEVARRQQAEASRPPRETQPVRKPKAARRGESASVPSTLLRDELLKLMSGDKPTHPVTDEKEIWEGLSQSLDVRSAEFSATEEPEPPPRKDKPRDSQEDWSTEW